MRLRRGRSQGKRNRLRRVLVPLFCVALLFSLVTLLGETAREDGVSKDSNEWQPTAHAAVINSVPPVRRTPTAVPTVSVSPVVPMLIAPTADPTPTWIRTKHQGTIAGFTDHVSAAEGDSLALYVDTPAWWFDLEVFRLGWYDDGKEAAQLVTVLHDLPGRVQPAPERDPATGLISAASWVSNGSTRVGRWPTGLYLLKLTASDGDQTYIPLVIRDDLNHHDFLFEHASTTEQAYNGWGGKSLYSFNSSGPPIVSGGVAATKVSFDRPFDQDGSGGLVLAWELNFVRYLESNHFDVGYISDLDVHDKLDFAGKADVVLQAGHNEYWSKEMRDHLESLSEQHKGLGLFTGDTGAWQMRFEDSALGRDRIQVCYKVNPDPIASLDPTRATTHWRDPPVNRPTQSFFGIGSGAGIRQSGDWVVQGADIAADLFAGTGLQNGDVIQNLVGYEYDGLWTEGSGPDLPANLTELGRSRVAPVDMVSSLLDFEVTHRWDADSQPSLGRLRTNVETLQDNSNWSLTVRLVAQQRKVLLVYTPDNTGAPTKFTAGVTDSVYIPLADDFYAPGWRSLERDLLADYRSLVGDPPADLRIESVTLAGAVTVGPISFDGADGTTTTISFSPDSDPLAHNWQVTHGQGNVSIHSSDAGGEAVLQVRGTIPNGRRADEANSVVIRAPGKGMIVAVGSVQWSWGLDAYTGFIPHVDAKNQTTVVDPRLQRLTGNLLRALLASTVNPPA